MSMPQAAVALLGLALLALPATAQDADLALPPVPDVTVSVEPATAPIMAPAGAEVPARAAAAVPARAEGNLDLGLPDLPEAAVTITVADRLPALLAARVGDTSVQLAPRLGKKEREAIAAFYALGGYKPLWVNDGAWTPAALALRDRLARAGEDGLDPAGYAVPQIAAGAADVAAEAASAELKLSAAAVLYARDARGARIEPGRLSRLITPKLELPGADAVLTALAASRQPGEALQRFNPQHPGYLALKRKLAEMRSGASPAKSRLEEDVVANMERWRWLPSDLGPRHILVNVPEFKLRLMDQGRLVHQARVIVGKPDTPTPLFSEVMDHAIVNPSWNVPPSIFKNEFYSDPAYAASRGYQVVQTRNGVSIRQPPGERNALGFIKFMFPNQHAVYLHDTPNRNLFASERRALSHGCVRLDQPFRFAEFVLGADWTEPRLRSLIGRGERTIRLPTKVRVHLAYFTVFVDETGELRQVKDLYAVNNKVRVALGMPSDGTTVAEAPRPKPRPKVAAQAPRSRYVSRTPMETPQQYAPNPFSSWWWTR
jgi:murein L,D-transpeptidase YcbB/YkuD